MEKLKKSIHIKAINHVDISKNLFSGEIVYDTDLHRYFAVDNNCNLIYIGDDVKENSNPRSKRPKICSCCGAPLHSDKCEYCGVKYS